MTGFDHQTVLLQECLAAIDPQPGAFLVDVTAGGGGHAAALWAASQGEGRLLCVDRDERAVAHLRARFAEWGERVQVVHGAFGDLLEVLEDAGPGTVDGLIADLGVSSPQLDEGERGFSFRHDGPLDMRMDRSTGDTALELIERCDERSLADLLFKYGEERRSRPIARSILRALAQGSLRTTGDLRHAVVRAVGPQRGRVDPSTRTFQALRIVVNDELGQLTRLLAMLPDLLADNGVAAIISFHSLEDRLVKHAFRDDERLEPLQRRPVIAGDEERALNPRARSAKLRAARRVVRAVEVTL